MLAPAEGVDDQLADEFAGGGIDNAHVHILDEQMTRFGPEFGDAHVVEAAVESESEFAVCVDVVVPGAGDGGMAGPALGRVV